jgi:hypothetical protein
VYGALEVVEGDGVLCYMPIVIWNGAGFPYRPGDERIPERVHLILLPLYSPELNPNERLWDVAKDPICNRVFETLDAIEEKLTEALRPPYWEKPAYARGLVGDDRLHTQANTSFANFIPNNF